MAQQPSVRLVIKAGLFGFFLTETVFFFPNNSARTVFSAKFSGPGAGKPTRSLRSSHAAGGQLRKAHPQKPRAHSRAAFGLLSAPTRLNRTWAEMQPTTRPLRSGLALSWVPRSRIVNAGASNELSPAGRCELCVSACASVPSLAGPSWQAVGIGVRRRPQTLLNSPLP